MYIQHNHSDNYCYNLLWQWYNYGMLGLTYWHSELGHFICKQLDSTCLLVLSRAAPPPKTLQPQWWQPRWGEGTLALTKSLASQQGSCRDCVDASLQSLKEFPLEFLWGFQSPSIWLLLCGRRHLPDLSVSALSEVFHLMREASHSYQVTNLLTYHSYLEFYHALDLWWYMKYSVNIYFAEVCLWLI